MKPIISFENLTFKYDSQKEPTLKNINVKICEGEKVLIVGASGSGKSTFLNCINGLIPYKQKGELRGNIFVNGLDLKADSLNMRSNNVGTVLQDTDSQFIALTAAEDIAFILENNNISIDKMKALVNEWSKKINMSEHLNKRPQDLSGGQKQRVSLGGILVKPTPILIFDEPLANLDPKAGQETMKIIEKIHKESKKTIVVVEHRLEEALDSTFDRVILFENGKIVANMSPDLILKEEYLKKAGIREPLYITALKYANINLSEIHCLSNINSLPSGFIAPYFKNWMQQPVTRSSNNVSDKKDTLLEMKDCSYQYNIYSKKTLNKINLSIKSGEMLSIIGHNGAGKSTLAKFICGFLKNKGTILWKGKDFSKLSISERASKVGYVMQNPNHMISQKMIYDEVALGLRLRGIDEEKIEDRVYKVLHICGLFPFRNWPISALSYGQKKRVTIASILVLDPEMIILDEPTAGQDFQHYTEMMEFLKKLNDGGKTIVLITHDMHLIVEYSTRSIVLSEGNIVANDLPTKILTTDSILNSAALSKTTLYKLANLLSISDANGFLKYFIEYDKGMRMNE